MQETWKPVVGYEGRYEVSDMGKVKSLKQGKILKGEVVHNGYLRVGLCKNNKSKWHRVHRLVLLSFVGECPEDCEGCHLDGNRKNNHIDNLKWVTRKENQSHRESHGTTCRGENNVMSKLQAEDISIIRGASKYGIEQKTLAGFFGVSQSAISLVMRRKSWKHIPEVSYEH